MSDNSQRQQKKPSRQQREAEALRQNLARRKAQQRLRTGSADSTAGESPSPGDSVGQTGKPPR